MWVNLREEILDEFLEAQFLVIEKARRLFATPHEKEDAVKRRVRKNQKTALARLASVASRVHPCVSCFRPTPRGERNKVSGAGPQHVKQEVMCNFCAEVRGLRKTGST